MAVPLICMAARLQSTITPRVETIIEGQMEKDDETTATQLQALLTLKGYCVTVGWCVTVGVGGG